MGWFQGFFFSEDTAVAHSTFWFFGEQLLTNQRGLLDDLFITDQENFLCTLHLHPNTYA